MVFGITEPTSYGIGDFSPEQGEAKAIYSNFFEINFG
jgi:hypothetical protein